MPICSVDNLQLPSAVMTVCDHCGLLMCINHLVAHHRQVKMTEIVVPKLMRDNAKKRKN